MSSAVRRVVWILALCVPLGGCAKKPVELTPSAAIELVWPSSPAQPRIKYLHSIEQPEDLGIKSGWLKRVRAAVKGAQRREVVNPYGISRSPAGDLYIVDTFYRQIHVYDGDHRKYHRFPKKRLPDFEHPLDIAIQNDGRIFVSDPEAGVVHIFEDKGENYVGQLGAGVLERPTGLAVRGTELLVADTKASRIVVFDTVSLTLTTSIGGDSGDMESFHYPVSIDISPSGKVYVTDSLNFRIQILDSELRFESSFGQAGNKPGSFSRPKGVAVDSDGNVYVIDALFDNVQIFNDVGELLLAFGSSGHEPGEFWLPTEIFIDGEDKIYIADSYNRRVQVFRYLKERQS